VQALGRKLGRLARGVRHKSAALSGGNADVLDLAVSIKHVTAARVSVIVSPHTAHSVAHKMACSVMRAGSTPPTHSVVMPRSSGGTSLGISS
jgi:hypothetical protein